MSQIKTEIIPADVPQVMSIGLELLRRGELVAFPTDTVYGLGALAFKEQAIEGLFAVKGRDIGKAIAVLVGDLADLPIVTGAINEAVRLLAARFWPGPLTLVVPRHPSLPDIISPNQTIGVRMPDHPIALRLLNLSGPLAVTSANLSGAASAVTAQEVLAQLGGRIPLILDGGRTPGGQPSTVIDCTGPELVLLRPGPLTIEQLKSGLNK